MVQNNLMNVAKEYGEDILLYITFNTDQTKINDYIFVGTFRELEENIDKLNIFLLTNRCSNGVDTTDYIPLDKRVVLSIYPKVAETTLFLFCDCEVVQIGVVIVVEGKEIGLFANRKECLDFILSFEN